jgi:hypothetical protein
MPNAPKKVTRPTGPPRTTRERGYGGEHRRLRAEALAEHPLCQHCGGDWATDYHHVDGNPFNRDAANRLMLCRTCHRRADDVRRALDKA